MKTLEQVKQEKKLTTKEEEALIKSYRETGEYEYRDMVIYDNLGIVQYMADDLQKISSKVSAEDLFQEGVVSLIEAINDYDYIRTPKRKSHESFRDYMVRKVGSSIQNAILAYDDSFQGDKDNKAVKCGSLDALNEEMGEIPIELILDKRVTGEAMHDTVEQIIDMLPERTQKIIRYRYGIGNDGPCTYTVIAKMLGCTSPRVREIEKSALHKIRCQAKCECKSNLVKDAYYFLF